MKAPIPFVFSLLMAIIMALPAPLIIQEEEVLDLERGLIEDSTQLRLELGNHKISMGEMQKAIQTSMSNEDNDDEVNDRISDYNADDAIAGFALPQLDEAGASEHGLASCSPQVSLFVCLWKSMKLLNPISQ